MSVLASIFEKALGVRVAGSSAFLALALGTAPDAANRIGLYADTTGAAEQLVTVVGAQAGPAFLRSGNSVIVTGLKAQDSTFQICDNSDITKTLAFQVGTQSSGFQLTIDVGAQAANRTLSVPVLGGADTIATRGTANTFSAATTFSSTVAISGLTDQRVVYTSGGVLTTSDELQFNVSNYAYGAGTAGTSRTMKVDGGASGVACGAAILAQNGAASVIGIGNYSAMFGGAYDATPAIYASGQIRCEAPIKIAGVTTVSDGTQAAPGIAFAVSPDTGLFFGSGVAITYGGVRRFTVADTLATFTSSVVVNAENTTDATSSIAAAVRVAGGLAVAKGQYIGTFLDVAGPAGSIVISAGSNARAAASYLNVNAAAGYTRAFTFQTGGNYRWLISCNSVAETGANAGSDFSFNAYSDVGSLIDQPLYIPRAGTGFIVFGRGLTQTFSDTATSTVSTVSTHGHNSTGTVANGFGSSDSWYLETTTTVDTVAYSAAVSWADATHASRKARVTFNVYDTAARECLRLEASGSAPMIGFLGAAAVIRATIAAATGTEKRTTFDTATVTLPELAGVVMALITDSRAYGLHG